MDIFVQNLDAIKKVALKLTRSYRGFQVNELVDASYICFDKVVTRHPELIEGKFSKLQTLLFRVKCDMRDYILRETKTRRKKYAEDNNKFFPSILSFDILGIHRGDSSQRDLMFEPEVNSIELERVDNTDLLNCLHEKVELTDKQWAVIKGYFYDGKTYKQIGEEIGLSECSVSKISRDSIKRYKETAELIGETR